MILKKNSIYNSILFEKYNNKLFLKGKKEKNLNILLNTWSNLKKSKLKPKLFFFLILEQIKPLFFFSKIKKKKNKKKKIIYKPYLLKTKQMYLFALKWFLMSLKIIKKFNFNKLLENCFTVFIRNDLKNEAFLEKKKIYIIILKYKKYIKI